MSLRTKAHRSEPQPLTVRIPLDLLASIDEYRATAPSIGTPSRNDVLVSLIERGLRDARRPRR